MLSYTPGVTVTQHICVCICTYKRPELLKHLLNRLSDQETDGLFTYSVVVADNDRLGSAKEIVSDFVAGSLIPVRYCVEPQQNIAMARNKAIENADGDYVAFFDDDQFPSKRWLLELFLACRKYRVDGVLGPVIPHFDERPPQWVVKCKLFERATYPTGFVIDGRKGRTGNVLLKKDLFKVGEQAFRPEFRTGEDQDFFGRMIQRGHVFVWCNEAVAFEVVPSIRWKRSFMLRKALLRGASSPLHSAFGTRDIVKSMIAVPAYAIYLPFSRISGHDKFMICLVKLFDHIGVLLALLGVNPIREPYITD
jgi:succinoglycan biosynthesis protein ExoM